MKSFPTQRSVARSRSRPGARFAGHGHLEMAHDELLNFAGGGTVSFEFQADRLEGMPVLLSHGQWTLDGWFFQILGRRLILRTTGGDAIGPEIEPGKWYSVRWEYDGLKSNLSVNKETLSTGQELRISPCDRMLHVGQYDLPGSNYAFYGSIRNLKITGWTQKSDSVIRFDFADGVPWHGRDGKTSVSLVPVDSRPTARLEIGGHGDCRFNSLWIRSEPISLDAVPRLRFRIRTSSDEPLAFLLQHEKDKDRWRAINLVGKQEAYLPLVDLASQKLNDGQWHEVSVDLRQALAGQIEPGQKLRIKNLIIGSWQNPQKPIVVEFQAFCIGPRS